MTDSDLREMQAPLKERYETRPDEAKIAFGATGEQRDDVGSCSVGLDLGGTMGVETDWTFQ